LLSFFFIGLPSKIYPEKITSIFFDIETIFKVDTIRASSYVGKIDSLRYLSQVGNLPSNEDLFSQLQPIKAQSTEITYNKNLSLPLILSDWLTNKQSSIKIKNIIQKYLTNKNITDIEKKVLIAIINMMLTPQHLADVQKINSKIEKLLHTLKQKGYRLYLVGNWNNIESLKLEFPELFNLFHGTFVSGSIHLLKPSEEFYSHILQKTNISAENALWIDTEQKFIKRGQQYGYKVIEYDPHNHQFLITQFQKYNIFI